MIDELHLSKKLDKPDINSPKFKSLLQEIRELFDEKAKILKNDLLTEWISHIFKGKDGFKKYKLKQLCTEIDDKLIELCKERKFVMQNKDFILKVEKVTSEALG